MQLDILTPEQKVFSGEATLVTLPGKTGSFQIMNNHSPLVAALTKGKLTVKTNSGTKEFTVQSGIVEVVNNKISVLVEGAE